MRRQFFTGLGWLVTLNLLVKPLWIFGIDRQVQNAVGNAAYGPYFATFNLTIILLFIADAGLTNLLTQRLASTQAVNTKQAFALKAMLLLCYTIVCVAVGWLAGVTDDRMLLYLIGIQCLGSLALFLRGLVAAHQLFTADATFSVLDKALVILFCAPLVLGWWGEVSIISFLRLQFIASLTACLVLGLFIRVKGLLQKGSDENLVATVKAVAPFAIIILLMATHYRLDGFLLERLHVDGATQAGIYAAAYRLLDAANMLGYLAASFLVPFVARNKAHNAMVQTTITWLQHSLMAIGLVATCFAVVFAPWVQQTLYHTNRDGGTVIQLTMAVLPAYYITHVYGSVLTAVGGFKNFITILFISVLVNATLNFFFIPLLGAVACCVAALASQFFCAAACYLAACRRMGWKPTAKTWLVYAVATGLLVLLLLLLKHFIASVWAILAATTVVLAMILYLQRRRLQTLFRNSTTTAHA